MKNFIGLLILLTLFSFVTQAQNSLIFKIQYKPETKYCQTIEQTTFSEVTFSGSREFLQKLKEKGIKNPTLTNTISKIETVFKTEKSNDGLNFPITIEIVKTLNSDGKKPIPDGTLIYGHSSNGKMPVLDSIASDGISEEIKKSLLQAMQSTFSQLNLPERQVEIGKSFEVESPLSIPIAGITIEFNITTTYKLLSITNNIADFDVSQVYTMKTKLSNYSIKGTGGGKGKLLYDVTNNYNLKYQTNNEMQMSMKHDKFKLVLKTKTGSIQTSVITDNDSK